MKSDTQRKTTIRTKTPTTTTTKETRSPQPQALATSNATLPVEANKPKLQPSREEIAKRAYEIYVARGKTDGREYEDWIQAERELITAINQRNN